jgi:hypothetical protein
LGSKTHPVTRLINFCWCWFKWGLIACVIGAALAVPYFYHRMDDEIRRRVEELFAKQYPNLQVKIRSAALLKGEGISIRGLTIVDPAAEGPCPELLSYDECFLVCPTDLSDLMSGEPRPTHVIVRRPTLHMTRRSDGTWSAARLLPLPRLSNGATPEIRVENGTIEVFDPTKSPACSCTWRDVNLTLTPIGDSELDSRVSAGAKTGTVPAGRRRHIQGTATGDFFRQISFEGDLDMDRPTVELSGKIDGLEISPEMRKVLPDTEGCNLAWLSSLRGETAAQFQISYDPAAAERWKFDVTGQLSHGRIEDYRLPYPLTEIHATVHVDNRGFVIRDLGARSNQATLSLSCSGGLTAGTPMDLECEIGQMPLDQKLFAILPAKLQQHWQDIQPDGVIDAAIQLHCDGRTLRPWAKIKCQNVSFYHVAFPYRLDHGSGTLELKDDFLSLDLYAYGENQLVRLSGELRNVFTGPTGWFRAKCDALPLDKKLLESCPADVQPLASSLHLQGTVAADLELSKDIAGGPLHKHLRAKCNRCSLRYDRFPYAISEINGQLEMYDGNWWFRNLDGCNGTSRITGDGTFACSPKGGELVLRLAAGDVPLEGELREALPAGMRQVWALLQPRGIIDLNSTIHYLSANDVWDVSVRAEPRGESCSLEPEQFPLEKVQGVFTYDSGGMKFERFTALHGLVKLACNGNCTFRPDGGWQLTLDRLTVDHLRLDRQFMQLLPAQLKKNLGELNATGPISLRGKGNVIVARSGNPAEPTTLQWNNIWLDLSQVGLDCGERLENLWGTVRVSGWSDGTRFQIRGEMDIESMTWHDLPFSQVLGPFWIDEQKALFGSWVAAQDNQALASGQQPAPQRAVVAKVFGGTVYGDGWAYMGEQPRFGIQARLVDADLTACDRDLAGKNRGLVGRIDGTVQLQGAGHNHTTLQGDGTLRLRNANIYELPAMVSLLKILSFKPPDPNAFSNSESIFHVQGEHVYFSKLDFNGDAISLVGKGEMNFQGDTRMVFAATLGRGDAGVPLVRNLFGGVSQQIMQIRVTGNMQDPHIERVALPGVNQALKNLQEQR